MANIRNLTITPPPSPFPYQRCRMPMPIQCLCKHETLTECWANVGPASPTLALHWVNVSCLLRCLSSSKTPRPGWGQRSMWALIISVRVHMYTLDVTRRLDVYKYDQYSALSCLSCLSYLTFALWGFFWHIYMTWVTSRIHKTWLHIYNNPYGQGIFCLKIID